MVYATVFTTAELGIQFGTHSHRQNALRMVEFGRQALRHSSFKQQDLSEVSKTQVTGHCFINTGTELAPS